MDDSGGLRARAAAARAEQVSEERSQAAAEMGPRREARVRLLGEVLQVRPEEIGWEGDGSAEAIVDGLRFRTNPDVTQLYLSGGVGSGTGAYHYSISSLAELGSLLERKANPPISPLDAR